MLSAAPAAAQAPPITVPQADEAAPLTYNGRTRQLDVRLTRADADIATDGILDEEGWQHAALLTGFSQYSPVDGVAAQDSTEVLVLYTDQAIHFGVRAFEPHGQVDATLADRDRIDADDYIMVLLDTFDDRRRALVFMINRTVCRATAPMPTAAAPT